MPQVLCALSASVCRGSQPTCRAAKAFGTRCFVALLLSAYVRVRLHRLAVLAMTNTSRLATAHAALAHTARALHFPHTWLQANAADVMAAVRAVQVIHARQQLLRIEQDRPLALRGLGRALVRVSLHMVPAQ